MRLTMTHRENLLNTQTERLDNQTARITVEVEPERLEKAKRAAAQKLSQRLNIPGFRKGKAPYKIIVNYVGEGALIEDAVEVLGNEVYKEVLDQSDLEPYGPGQIEDFKTDTTPTFTFVVPLQPTVDLKDYRSVRRDYAKPAVEDKALDQQMRALQEQYAIVETSPRPVALGDRITAFVDGRLVEEGEDPHAHDHDHDHEADEEGHHHHVDEKTILHEHEAVISLEEDAVIPGFSEALVGATIGERREFDLTYPDDKEEYEELAGKTAHFDVTVQKIENVTLPALNDDLAARATAEEETPLTLLQLRMRTRENLEKMAEDRYNADYARDALVDIVDQAEIHYPEAMVVEQIERFKQQLDQDLRQRGLTLDAYKRIYRKTDEDLFNEYREPSIRAIERALVMREIARAEALTVTDERMREEIERMSSGFGEQADEYRKLFDAPFMRQSLANDLLSQVTMDRVA
jgi:trigger factor